MELEQQLQRLGEGIKAAHEAGNEDHVKKLGAEYRRLQAQQPTSEPAKKTNVFSSFGDAFKANVDPILEGMGTTAEVFGRDGTAKFLRDLTEMPENYESGTERFLNADEDGSYAWRYLPAASAEQAGQFAGSIASRAAGAVGGAAVGSLAGPKGTAAGAVAGSLAGPALFEIMQVLGPIAQTRAKNNGRETPNTEDMLYAAGTSAGMGILNAAAPNASGVFRRMLIEGGTEGLQSALEQTGESIGTEAGLEVSGREALAEGIIGGTSAGGVDTTIKGVQKTAEAAGVTSDAAKSMLSRVDYDDFTDDDRRAAVRLIEAADGDDTILGNVGHADEGSAKAATHAAIDGIKSEISVIAKDLRALAKHQNSREAEAALDALVRTTQARTTATPKSFQAEVNKAFRALDRAEISGPDIQRLTSLSNQMNRIQAFARGDKGDMGGFSRMTSRFDITDPRSTSSLGGIAVAASGSLGTAGTVVAANRLARRVDAITNRRSRVKRFVDSALRDGTMPPDIHGPDAREALSSLRAEEAAAKAQAKLEERQARQQGRAPQQAPNVGTPNGPLDQSKAQAQTDRHAETFGMNKRATEAMFAADNVPADIPYYAPYRRWQEATGAGPQTVYNTLQQLEAEGHVPQGTADRFRGNIRSFGSKSDDTYSIQEMVRQTVSPDYKPKFSQEKATADSALDSYNNMVAKPKGDRRKFKAERGEIESGRLTEEIRSAEEALSADQYQDLMSLKEAIDSAGVTRAERFKLINDLLPQIFPDPSQAALVDIWRKKFTPLAAIGNEYAIERGPSDPVQADKEKAFDKKRSDASKPRKVRTGKAANLNRAPINSDPQTGEIANLNRKPATDSPTETTVDRALRKLKTPRKPTEETETDKPSEKTVKAEEPTPPTPKKKTKGNRNSLKERVQNRIEAIYEAINIAANKEDALNEHIRNLPKSAEGRVEGLIYQHATDRVTANMLVNAYANIYGMDPQQAANQVNRGLDALEAQGKLRRRLVKGNAKMRRDGSYVRDAEGTDLINVDLQFHNPNARKPDGLDPTIAEHLNTAKAVRQVERMVPQGGPEQPFTAQDPRDGAFSAFKDISPERVDESFRPILDFLNDMREMDHSINPAMLSQIEKALGGKGKNLGPIGDVLQPKDRMGRTDESVMRTVAQLLFTRDESGSPLMRQEWMAGANLRVYSKNGNAHSQAGDIMKGIIRAPQKSKVGGEGGFKYLLHGLGNLLGFDKAAPADRRNAIFQDGMIDNLIKFANDPFSRRRLKTDKGKNTPVGQMVADGEGFFQVLNAAHEVKNMVDWSRARHKNKSKMTDTELLNDPEVQQDLSENYDTDFIVQLDASNNAYQIAGMVMGYEDVLRSTGLLPQEGTTGDPDTMQGADIYLGPAVEIAQRIPELADLDLPDTKLRAMFKRPIGTYLYAAEFNSRKAAFADELAAIADGAPIFGVDQEGLITVPEATINEMMSEEGHRFVVPKYDQNGQPKKSSVKRRRVVPAGEKFAVESAEGDTGVFKRAGRLYDTQADAIADVYGNNLYTTMNSELIREMNTRYSGMRHYLDFAKQVSELMREQGHTEIKVPTKDGMMLEYSFKQDPVMERADTTLQDGTVVPMGIEGVERKVSGRGLAAFMTHQNDAWALRETYKRMKESGLETFNPIHDSYGFHPADAQRGFETWVQVMQELGSADYNIFLDILNANQIDPMTFIQSFKNPEDQAAMRDFIMGRQGVPQVDPSQIPTSLS